jgi:transcriptional regulator with XRE-family HTH domain
MTQAQLGADADMKQARISTMERVGDASFSIETLIRLAAAFRVGIAVEFVSMSEMLNWENGFQPDSFDVEPIERDERFIRGAREDFQGQVPAGMIQAMSGKSGSGQEQTAVPVFTGIGHQYGDSSQASHFGSNENLPAFTVGRQEPHANEWSISAAC